MSEKKFYDGWITLKKGVLAALYYTAPYLFCRIIEFYPEAMSLTVGTALIMLQNMLKNFKK